MKRLISISIISAVLCGCAPAIQEEALFTIREGGKTGYINSSGKVIIQPRFANGYDFSEGMAAVRDGGLFGYINSAGKFLIEPKYDHAISFVNGAAMVIDDGQKMLINKKGEILLAGGLESIYFTEKGLVQIRSSGNKYGLFSPATGKFIVDTVYESINCYPEGVAIIAVKDPASKYSTLQSVIDLNGNVVVPVGKYENIGNFSDGVSIVHNKVPGKNELLQSIIDIKGKEVGHINPEGNLFASNDFKNGFSHVIFYNKQLVVEEGDTSFRYTTTHEGFINAKGEIAFSDTAYKTVTDFSCNRSFIRDAEGHYTMIDQRFNKLTKPVYTFVGSDGFSPDGYAIVRTDEGTGIIDTMGRYILKPGKIPVEESSLSGNFFFATTFAKGEVKYSLHRLNGDELISPVLETYRSDPFVKGVMKTLVNDRPTYFDTTGRIIWQQKESSEKSMVINTDAMTEGYFRAGFKTSTSSQKHGGFTTSDNYPKKITRDNNFTRDSLSLTIDTANSNPLSKSFAGYKVYLANAGKQSIPFDAQDSRLYIRAQALDKNGEWRDIEHLLSSWCGNSYHEFSLEPDTYWQFSMPAYQGITKTRIRLKLEVSRGKKDKAAVFLYSNEINASVNPGQFSFKSEYIPANLMDPYTN